MNNITINRVENVADLYCRYPKQNTHQPCYIELNPWERTLYAGYNAEIGNSVPMDVWHHRLVRYDLPYPLTADAANTLMENIATDASIVCDGYTAEWDGHNTVGVLTDEAREASRRIKRACERSVVNPDNLLRVVEDSEWFSGLGNHDSIREHLGINADTTDGQLGVIAAQELAASDQHVIDDLDEYLRWLRDEVREAHEISD